MRFRSAQDGREFEVEIIARDGAALRARIGDEEVAAEIEPAGDGAAIVRFGARRVRIFAARGRNSFLIAAGPDQFEFAPVEGRAGRGSRGLANPQITAPMPGKVLRLLVEEGQTIVPGQPLIVLEAMKMETTLYAEGAATVKKIHAMPDAMVDHGAVLIELSSAADSSASESQTQAR